MATKYNTVVFTDKNGNTQNRVFFLRKDAEAFAMQIASLEQYTNIDVMVKSASFADLWKSIVGETDYPEEKEKMGIDAAGPVPNSLLARQDLEPTESSYVANKGYNIQARDLKIGDCIFIGGRYGYVTSVRTFLQANRIRTAIKVKYEDGVGNDATLDADDMVVMKGAVEQTGKELTAAVDKAEDVSTEKQKDALVDRIKAVQVKRQKATIQAREKNFKPFREGWADMNKS